jgi:hypothetical protein
MLPDSVVSTLRTNETAALAAALIIAGSFPEIASFAARVADAPHGRPDAPKPPRAAWAELIALPYATDDTRDYKVE